MRTTEFITLRVGSPIQHRASPCATYACLPTPHALYPIAIQYHQFHFLFEYCEFHGFSWKLCSANMRPPQSAHAHSFWTPGWVVFMKPHPQGVLSANTVSCKQGMYCTGDGVLRPGLTSCYIKLPNLSPQCNISYGALSVGHWIFGHPYCNIARLSIMQTKGATDNRDLVGLGLFAYPVLMAADVLLYR